jgi:hypothetical protein
MSSTTRVRRSSSRHTGVANGLPAEAAANDRAGPAASRRHCRRSSVSTPAYSMNTGTHVTNEFSPGSRRLNCQEPPIHCRTSAALQEKGHIMLINRDIRDSRTNVRGRFAPLTMAATLLVVLIGLGAASPALADHETRRGPSVEFRAAFPLPLLFSVPVIHTASYRERHYDRGLHHGHYRDYDRSDHFRGHARVGEWNRHSRAAKHFKRHIRHDRYDRRHAHRRH